MDEEIGPRILAAFSSIIRTTRALESSTEPMGDVPSSVIAALGVLSDTGELRLSAVAVSLGVDSSVVSRTVAVAEQQGLISRRPDPRDGRACLLSLTERGSQSLAARCNRRLRLLSAVLDEWEPGSAETLLAGLTRLRDGLAASGGAPTTVRIDPPAA